MLFQLVLELSRIRIQSFSWFFKLLKYFKSLLKENDNHRMFQHFRIRHINFWCFEGYLINNLSVTNYYVVNNQPNYPHLSNSDLLEFPAALCIGVTRNLWFWDLPGCACTGREVLWSGYLRRPPSPPSNSYVEILMSDVMILGGEAFGRIHPHDGD